MPIMMDRRRGPIRYRRGHSGLSQALAWYRWLTTNPDIDPQSRALNEISALPIIWDALQGKVKGRILEVLAQRSNLTTRELTEAIHGAFTDEGQKVIAELLSQLMQLLDAYQVDLLERDSEPIPTGGAQFRYELTPLGRAMMRQAWNRRTGR